MNGVGTRKMSFDAKHGNGQHLQPLSKTLIDGYQDGLNGGSYGGLSPTVANGERHSTMLNPNDPVAMHLLMEHALGDSSQYQILSFDEIDELKREQATLANKIDATKRKLAIEVKIRDAATSMNRLDSPGQKNSSGDMSSRRHQRNLLSKGSGSDMFSKTDDELAASVRKCEDLSQELWKLEKRSQEVQRFLLEHTAGILQFTHKGSLDKDTHSSAGMNGLSNGYVDSGLLDPGFDDRSFYQTLDAMLDSTGPNAHTGINSRVMLDLQQRLLDLNSKLQDAITKANSGRPARPPPQPDPKDQTDPEKALVDQIDYTEKSLESIQRAQSEAANNFQKAERGVEEKLEGLNGVLREIVMQGSQDSSSQIPLPPQASGRGPDAQFAFLQGGLTALEQDVRKLRSHAQASHTRSRSHEEKMGQYESTFQSLWNKLIAEEEAIRKTDGDSNSVPKEKFSIDSFATKVDLLNTRAVGLGQQKDILSRQIQQQRELNSKSDKEKDARITSMTQELEQAKTADQELQQLRQTQQSLQELADSKSAEAARSHEEMQEFETEMVRLQTELTVARAELDGAYGTRAQRAAEVAQHPALLAEIAELKEELSSAKNASNGNTELQNRVQTLQKELTDTISEFEMMTKSSIEFEKERESLESTIDGLRDKCEKIETELSEEKVGKLGAKSPGVAGDRSSGEKGATSTSVLKTEFKKMMRETRAEHLKMLRHEQEERRKLEAQIRALKKDQTPGKSSLSQSMSAS